MCPSLVIQLLFTFWRKGDPPSTLGVPSDLSDSISDSQVFCCYSSLLERAEGNFSYRTIWQKSWLCNKLSFYMPSPASEVMTFFSCKAFASRIPPLQHPMSALQQPSSLSLRLHCNQALTSTLFSAGSNAWTDGKSGVGTGQG